eukprot:gene20162-22137_t
MGEIDPDTLLEWLTMGQGDERDMQLIALEQLCMLLLMSDNVDRCFESCPPRTFLPALCHIFMDETAPDSILEVTARAITYYLDVSAECSRRIVSVEGAVKALCTRLMVVDITLRTSKDLAEQCVKVLELMCTREAGAIYDAGGLTCILSFIREYGFQIHKDTLHSAMSVVARLCAKMEPSDQNLEHCVDSLSVLLQAEDVYVADGALRCFACLADRFTRRGIDPAPLAKHGLSNVLLEKLAISATQFSTEKPSSLPATSPDTRSNAGNVSIVVSVLSTLFRGSPSVTHDLLRSDFLNAVEKAMQGDERCVLDTMRLIDLLLVLLFEGRDALPKSNSLSARNSLPGLKRMDSSTERSHRHLIDCIRSKDTDALIEAVDSGAFEVNYIDDVGQTLLNWASAFGTLEMVEFLCERGADVNRGQRSSSLHYAACFGRPAVAMVLLKYGANPDLRDEDGKTPLDKARERNDEGHKEIVRILQIPGEWIVAGNGSQASGASSSHAETDESKPDAKQEDKISEPIVKGDPEMAPVYVKRLLPVFCQTFRSSLVPSIRKATLSIVKKVIHLIPGDMMPDVIASSNIASNIVEVLSSILNTEDDDNGHFTAFQCVEDLMNKAKDTFLVHFVRLGVLNRIKEISESFDKDELEIGDAAEHDAKRQAEIMPLDDAQSITQGKPYNWHDWCIARSRDCLYLWSDFCAIELSNGSNGWFRFVLDGKLATMYSSGSPEGGSGSAESRSEFLEKLQRARSQVPVGMISQPLLSSPTASSNQQILVGNWSLACKQPGYMTIHNADGQQATILKEDLPGFIFESNRGTKHTFTAETSLGPDFAATWSGKPGRRYQSKKDQIRRKIGILAHDINAKYFEEAVSGTYGAMGKLREISTMLDDACSEVLFPTEESEKKLYAALKELCDLLKEESILSSYEIQSSGLVTSLFNCLNKSSRASLTSLTDKSSNGTSEIFKAVFGEMPQNVNGDESMHQVSLAVALVRKLIAVLESIEKFPVVSYENGGGSGLQILLRRLRVRLERDSKSGNLIDQSGKHLKMEPLTTVRDLKKHLLKVVAKQWYDYERNTFKFIKHFKENKGALTFNYESDFDANGIVYWVGTNARSFDDWINPAQYGLMVVASSDGRGLPYGKPDDVLSREAAALNCHTRDDKNSWFIIDAGLWITPTAYTLRHARGYGRSALRNWTFQGSKEGQTWTTLFTHTNDASLNEPGSTATWVIDSPSTSEGDQAWRMFRIQQTGPNASGQTHYLSLSGFEIYGTVSGVTEDTPGLLLADTDSGNRKQRRVFRSQVLRQLALGKKEIADLRLLKERARQLGVAVDAVRSEAKNEGWVDVSWIQSTDSNVQSRNAQPDQSNIQVVDISDPDVQTAISQAEKKDVNSTVSTKPIDSTTCCTTSTSSEDSHANLQKDNDATAEVADASSNKVTNDSTNRDNSVDLANFRLLMAVEDLLDNASSDLVASALAEARNLDQLRASTRSLQTPFLSSAIDIEGMIRRFDQRLSDNSVSRDSTMPLVDNEVTHGSLEHDTMTPTETAADADDVTNAVTDQVTDANTNADADVDADTNAEATSDADVTATTQAADVAQVAEAQSPTAVDEGSWLLSSSFSDNRGSGELVEVDSRAWFFDALGTEAVVDKAERKENSDAPCNEVNDIKRRGYTEITCIDSDDQHSGPQASSGSAVEQPTVEPPFTEPPSVEPPSVEPLSVEPSTADALVEPSSVDDEVVTLSRSTAVEGNEEASKEAEPNEVDLGQRAVFVGLPSTPLQDGEEMQHERPSESTPSTAIEGSSTIGEANVAVATAVDASTTASDTTTMMNLAKKFNVEAAMERLLDADKYGREAQSSGKQQTPMFFDARIDEVSSESDKNLQNNRSRAAPIDEGDMLFAKNTQTSRKLYPTKVKPRKVVKKTLERAMPLSTSGDDKGPEQEDLSKSSAAGGSEKTPAEMQAKDESKPLSANQRETCSLMVDMEEDYMEDYPMDDGEDTDEFEDIENEDENDPEDLYERAMNMNRPSSSTDKPTEARRRLWDDDFVLKRQFSALIPAFDPRPGRTNVSQNQDLVIPEDEGEAIAEESRGDELKLSIKGTNSSGKEFEIDLDDSDASVFSYIQKLSLNTSSTGGSGSKLDRHRKVWEPTYTVVYRSRDAATDSSTRQLIKWSVQFVDKYLGTNKLPKTEVVQYLQQNADAEFIRKWKLTGTIRSCRKQRNCNQLRNAYRDFSRIKEHEARLAENDGIEVDDDVRGDYPDVFASIPSEVAPAKEVLDLVKSLHKLCEENMQLTSLADCLYYSDDYLFDVPDDEFISMKLTNKLMQQIQEPLVLASGALPSWCEFLVINYPQLFPFETRKMYFQATAFGCSRSIVWLQSLHDANLERSRGHSARRLEPQEIRIGRLKHERVKVPRNHAELLQHAIRLLNFHAGRKAILEIEFKDEEGTGLGPSLEFYALVAKELQMKHIGMWVASDNLSHIGMEDEINGEADVYVHHPNGLFPAPYPQDYKDIDRICRLFHFLGIFLAKCLQDNRLVDIPLSEPFHKLLCLGKLPPSRSLSRSVSSRSENADCENVSPRSSDSTEFGSVCSCCYVDLFSDCDFEMIYPDVHKFTKQLKKLVTKRKEIINDCSLSEEVRSERLAGLLFETDTGHECKLQDLGLTFQYIPPSKSYGFDAVDLKANGDQEALTPSNAEEYIDLMMNFSMYKGIEKQLDAFRAGFNRVFPMENLHAFSPREIQLMLSGEQAPQWTRDDLINYTEPKFGYTKESPGFQRLINVLLNMTGEERKAFLQFATGCSSLPPGGIANLHPRLTVVKKESEGDGSYPSVNTCVHYLKLPEYSSEEILRSKLLAATKEKGFHLN